MYFLHAISLLVCSFSEIVIIVTCSNNTQSCGGRWWGTMVWVDGTTENTQSCGGRWYGLMGLQRTHRVVGDDGMG